jgi:hypothetical protein
LRNYKQLAGVILLKAVLNPPALEKTGIAGLIEEDKTGSYMKSVPFLFF